MIAITSEVGNVKLSRERFNLHCKRSGMFANFSQAIIIYGCEKILKRGVTIPSTSPPRWIRHCIYTVVTVVPWGLVICNFAMAVMVGIQMNGYHNES